MNSIGEDCNELKKQYEECFNSWFSDHFLKGKTHDVCRHLFANYQSCVKEAMIKKRINVEEVQKDVLGTDREQKSQNTKKS